MNLQFVAELIPAVLPGRIPLAAVWLNPPLVAGLRGSFRSVTA